jgi:hypothetical protein
MKRIQQVVQTLCLLSTAILLLSGCSVSTDRTDKPSDAWSRGLSLGTTGIKQPVALRVDAQRHVHLVWCEIAAARGDSLHYAHLNERGQVLISTSLDIDLPYPRKPQLLIDGENHLNLAWLSRVEGRQSLYHVLIDQNGRPTEPLLLSREEKNVENFQMILSAEGETVFFWSSEPGTETGNEQKGIYFLSLYDTSPPTLLVPQGIDPYVLVDNSGTTHLTWLTEEGVLARDIYYATLQGSRVVPDGGQKLTDFELAEGAVYHGPIIGVDTNNVYVIWTIQNLGGGLTPTAAFAFYVSFESGRPALTNSRSIVLPSETTPQYVDYASPYSYDKLALLPPQVYGSDFVNAPATVRSQESELPVTFSMITASTAESNIQVASVVLSEGKPVGYQLASDTPNASVDTTLVADADANLHLAWIDTAGFRQYDVYYASTSPEVKSWLDRTSTDDIVLGAADLVWGIISGIGLLPIVAIWNFPPLMWVVVFYIFSGREYLERMGAKVGLFVSIVIYAAAKLLLLPGLAEGTPFLHQLPRAMASTVATALPVTIFLLALGAMGIYARRSERASLFKAYFVFALTDGVLTVVLYAPGLFNPG